MKEPKRYYCGNGEGMFEDDKNGHWVEYSEHKAIVEALTEQLRKHAISDSVCYITKIREIEERNNQSITFTIHEDGSGSFEDFWSEKVVVSFDSIDGLEKILNERNSVDEREKSFYCGDEKQLGLRKCQKQCDECKQLRALGK